MLLTSYNKSYESLRTFVQKYPKVVLKESNKPRPTHRQIIATLLELIGNPKASRDEIAIRCQRSGVSVSYDLVDEIFETYDLDKKRAL